MQVINPRTRSHRREVDDARHDRAADAHDVESKRHDEAAWYWAARGDHDKARLAGRNATLDRELADVDRDQARLERHRGLTLVV